MIQMPEIKKTERDLMGQFTIDFVNKDDGKEFTNAFTELRAGISWPIQEFPGYMCVLGLFSGAVFGTENTLMLVYEREYENAVQLMTDAYNCAADLRLTKIHTNCQLPDWKGYNLEFDRKIRSKLGARGLRLHHSPFAEKFAYGKDYIKRLANEKALVIPSDSLLMTQLRGITPDDLRGDRAGERFHAINGFRFLIVAWDLEVNAAAGRQGPSNQDARESVLGWS